jgi:hypothetical protein
MLLFLRWLLAVLPLGTMGCVSGEMDVVVTVNSSTSELQLDASARGEVGSKVASGHLAISLGSGFLASLDASRQYVLWHRDCWQKSLQAEPSVFDGSLLLCSDNACAPLTADAQSQLYWISDGSSGEVWAVSADGAMIKCTDNMCLHVSSCDPESTH